MPFWFVGLFVVALVGFFASWSGDLVLISSIYSFGVLLPVWYVAANLWWILLFCIPWVWLGRRGKPLMGLGFSAAAFVAVLTAANLHVGHLRDQIIPVSQIPPPGLALSGGAPRSIEIIQNAMTSPDPLRRECDVICERLLTGPDLAWIRVRTGAEGSPALIYYRADAADCVALDASFPAAAPCLLARPDDGATPDLSVAITDTGNYWAAMQPDHGWVYLTGTQRLTLTDQRGPLPRVIDDRTRYFWSEPSIGILIPAMTALGSGRKFDGAHFDSHFARSDPFDLTDILTHAGLTLGPDRGAMAQPEKPHKTWERGPYAVTVAYDASLLTSMLAAADVGKLTPGQSEMVRDWVLPFDPPRPSEVAMRVPDEAERRLLLSLAKVRGTSELNQTLQTMTGRNPDLFVADFGELFRTVVSGTKEDSARARNAASLALQQAPTGTYDAFWPDYVAAVESRDGGKLILQIGKFTMDPLPVLRRQLDQIPEGWPAQNVLFAACSIDERWWPTLAPVEHQAALGLIPQPGDAKLREDELRTAIRALIHMGRADLARDVADRIDWQLVAAMPYFVKRPRMPGDIRDRLNDYVAGEKGC